ncbi:MAG: hypothetical protein AB1351_01795 [Thermoproteota archaeon]
MVEPRSMKGGGEGPAGFPNNLNVGSPLLRRFERKRYPTWIT